MKTQTSMKTHLIFLLLVGIANSVFAQVSISGKVLDATTKSPVPYVSIGVKELAKGTVSDDLGQYELKEVAANAVLTFSSIGYQPRDILAEELAMDGVVELVKKHYELDMVEVQATRFSGEEKIFGLKNKKRGPSIGFGNPQLGSAIGSLIRLDRPTYIKSANFVLNHAKGDSLLFRVNIHAMENGKVGDNLLTENVLIKEKQRKGTITVDLTDYNLILDTDVLLSVEWIKDFDELGSKGVTFDLKRGKKSKGVYLKLYSTGSFRTLPYQRKYAPCFYFVGKQ